MVGVCRVARGGVEPPTFRFSVGRSYQLSYLAAPGPCYTPGMAGARQVSWPGNTNAARVARRWRS